MTRKLLNMKNLWFIKFLFIFSFILFQCGECKNTAKNKSSQQTISPNNGADQRVIDSLKRIEDIKKQKYIPDSLVNQNK